jgi:hypothetical protein
MKAYVAVFSTPYFQVTGEDGSFQISGVPPGIYTLNAWHEFYGTSEQTLTLTAGETKSVSISFKSNSPIH